MKTQKEQSVSDLKIGTKVKVTFKNGNEITGAVVHVTEQTYGIQIPKGALRFIPKTGTQIEVIKVDAKTGKTQTIPVDTKSKLPVDEPKTPRMSENVVAEIKANGKKDQIKTDTIENLKEAGQKVADAVAKAGAKSPARVKKGSGKKDKPAKSNDLKDAKKLVDEKDAKDVQKASEGVVVITKRQDMAMRFLQTGTKEYKVGTMFTQKQLSMGIKEVTGTYLALSTCKGLMYDLEQLKWITVEENGDDLFGKLTEVGKVVKFVPKGSQEATAVEKESKKSDKPESKETEKESDEKRPTLPLEVPSVVSRKYGTKEIVGTVAGRRYSETVAKLMKDGYKEMQSDEAKNGSVGKKYFKDGIEVLVAFVSDKDQAKHRFAITSRVSSPTMADHAHELLTGYKKASELIPLAVRKAIQRQVDKLTAEQKESLMKNFAGIFA